MLHRICSQHQISDINLCLQGTGNSRVNDSLHSKAIHQNLYTHRAIDLSHTGADYHHILPAYPALIKIHSCHRDNLRALHLCL